MNIGFGIASTSDPTVTINSGDSVQVNMAIQLRIAGLDSAIVQVSKSDLPMDLPKITFPSEIEIYGGVLKSPSGFEVNEIKLNSLTSSYPLKVDFFLNLLTLVQLQ